MFSTPLTVTLASGQAIDLGTAGLELREGRMLAVIYQAKAPNGASLTCEVKFEGPLVEAFLISLHEVARKKVADLVREQDGDSGRVAAAGLEVR